MGKGQLKRINIQKGLPMMTGIHKAEFYKDSPALIRGQQEMPEVRQSSEYETVYQVSYNDGESWEEVNEKDYTCHTTRGADGQILYHKK